MAAHGSVITHLLSQVCHVGFVCVVLLKGSKIGFFKNWICESRWPGRDNVPPRPFTFTYPIFENRTTS